MSNFSKETKKIFSTLFGILFVCFSFLAIAPAPVYAAPLTSLEQKLEDGYTKNEVTSEEPKAEQQDNTTEDGNFLENLEQKLEDKYVENHDVEVGSVCTDQSGAVGWIICPTTGVIAKASDAIYSMIEDILKINPATLASDSTVHIIWQYVRDITNIVFIIFLLIVVISHLTGFGISNYNLKRILPRLVVITILVNISFIICQLAIDTSNILGSSIRGTLYSIEEQAISQNTNRPIDVSWNNIIEAVTGTGVIAGLSITLTSGLSTLFWALIPALIGAIVSVFIGLITISLRQGLVIVLTMIAPLAFVCFLLPNTEGWFKKWKSLFMKMLIFYPMFSFLFGASHIAGWAIITSSVNEAGETSGFGIIVGLVVQVFPLFGSWSLMKMSGTILGAVSDRLHRISAKPLAAINRASGIKREEAKSKYLGGTPKGVSQEVMQKIHNRQVRSLDNTKRYNDRAAQRGIAYSNKTLRNRNGNWTKRAEDFYEMQADSMEDQETIARISNDFNKGLGLIPNGSIKGSKQAARLGRLDIRNMNAADNLKYQIARGSIIEHDNAQSFHERSMQAINAHFDNKHINSSTDRIAGYVAHDGINSEDLIRYNKMLQISDGKKADVQKLAADASYTFSAQRNSMQNKLNAYYTLTPATQDVVYHLNELASDKKSSYEIDAIISGLRTLNDRGDTDLINDVLDKTLISYDDEGRKTYKVQLGTNASQSIANFLMFEVKDKDPFLRRFGKYINLQTAKSFNADSDEGYRRNHDLTLDEYITGYYEDTDKYGNKTLKEAKKSMVDLLNGTSFKGVERTTLSNMMRRIAQTYTDDDGNIDMEAYTNKLTSLDKATFANFISDQFSWLSGSEQITSFAKYVTGVKKGDDGKYVTDWDGIFGKRTAATLSDADKQSFEEFQTSRTKSFLNGQVANQVARTKSDILNSVLGKFEMDTDEHLTDAERKEAAGQTFINSLNTDVYDNLISMYDKGFQGDTKANLVTAIHLNDPEQIKRVRAKKSKKGLDTTGSPTPHRSPTPTYNPTLDARSDILDMYHAARSNSSNVAVFWNRARARLIQLPDYHTRFGEIEASISSYTNIATLYNDILSKL